MHKAINTALIGYGYWGPNLARNLHELPESKFIACCDLDPARLAQAQRLYQGIVTTTHVEDILANPNIDAVVIASPAPTHFHLARAALKTGKHVLVEKPLALNSKNAEDLISLAETQRLVLMVGHTFEYNPAILKIKEILCSGQVGDVYYAYSTRVNLGRVRRDTNALWSISPHDVSTFVFLFNQMPIEVSATGISRLTRNVEDATFITLYFPANILVHIHVSWLDPSKVRQTTIVGSKKMIVYDDLSSEGKVKVYDRGVLALDSNGAYGEFQYRLHSGDIYIPKIELIEPLYNECLHFIECIRKGKRPRSDGESGLRVVKILEAAQYSLEQRGVPVLLQ